MKTSPYLLALIACILMGCGMAEVVDWGKDCPGKDAEGELSYIGDPSCTAETGDSCRIEDKTYDFKTNFNIKRCPTAFPKCIDNKPEGVYHCEKDTKTECADTQIACPKKDGSEGIDCIDPSTLKTCGATDCESINYGGQDCTEYGESGRCQFSNESNSYVCRCPNNALLCGKQCIQPGDSETCGASDCSAENYGGDDCTAYDDIRECNPDADGKFSCQCRKNFILCDDKCVNPSSDQTHCGARGTCTAPEPESENYAGENCESGDGSCSAEHCTCSTGKIWCIPEGSEEPRCVSPTENATCGAHLIEGTNRCEFIVCDDNQSCSNVADEYKCKQISCPDNEQLCTVDGEKACISRQDPMNCGGCDFKCENESRLNAHDTGCKLIGNDYKCAFECDEGFTNCPTGDEFNPNCHDLQKDPKNCGECGNACPGGETCADGKCMKKVCKSNQCQKTDANGDPTCMNEVTSCGGGCQNCQTELHAETATCTEGVCQATKCMENYHLKDNGCEKNDKSACGPTDGPGVNCITQDIINATCSAAGSCIVSECKAGSHINANKTGCTDNGNTACGAATSNSPVDCTKLDNVSKASCMEGKCAVTECKTGFHLNPSKTGCEANSKSACGSTTGTATDCTKIANTAETECESGACKVKSCAANFHLNAGATECVSNSDTACAATNSSQTTNCTSIANSTSANCLSGKCVVSNCKNGFHINSAKSGCDANSNSSCAPTNSNKVQNCSTGIAKYCVGGECKCSTDNSTVLNYDKNSCVVPACQGIPGVLEGAGLKSGKKCFPKSCVSGYYYNPGDSSNFASCLPYNPQIITDCSTMGYKQKHEDICCACSESCTRIKGCGPSGCGDGYKHYHAACLKYDVCCTSDCINCLAEGKKCNGDHTACVD